MASGRITSSPRGAAAGPRLSLARQAQLPAVLVRTTGVSRRHLDAGRGSKLAGAHDHPVAGRAGLDHDHPLPARAALLPLRRSAGRSSAQAPDHHRRSMRAVAGGAHVGHPHLHRPHHRGAHLHAGRSPRPGRRRRRAYSAGLHPRDGRHRRPVQRGSPELHPVQRRPHRRAGRGRAGDQHPGHRRLLLPQRGQLSGGDPGAVRHAVERAVPGVPAPRGEGLESDPGRSALRPLVSRSDGDLHRHGRCRVPSATTSRPCYRWSPSTCSARVLPPWPS